MNDDEARPPDERRKDINTRKVIEVLSEKIDEKLEAKLKGVVMWERLVAILGAAAVVIITAVWVVIGRAEARSERAEQAVSTLRKDSGDAIQLVREELKDTRTDIRGLYRTIRTNQPQARLSTPVPELPPNPITTPKEP